MLEVAGMMRLLSPVGSLACQLAQKLLLVHAVFEGFTPVDKDHGDFIGELATKAIVHIHIHLAPAKAASAFQLRELFLNDFAEMASFA
jgi:hypothetical protein